MKSKIIKFLVICLILIPINAYAKGSFSVSTKSIVSEPGTKTFDVIGDNVTGQFTISSSNTSVATVSANESFIDSLIEKKQTFTVTLLKEGHADLTITLNDMATFDEEELTGTYKISVDVKKKEVETPQTPTKQTTPTSPSTPSSNEQQSVPIKIINMSNNTTLNNIKINDKEATLENGKYIITVEKNVDKVTINAEAKDSKATVSGNGEHSITLGSNIFTINVKAENGDTKDYTLIVNRSYESLKGLLFVETNDVTYELKDNEIITKDLLDKIKELKIKVTLVKKDSDSNILYKLVIDGSLINETKDFDPTVKLDDSSLNDYINNAKGLTIVFNNDYVPKDIQIVLDVSKLCEDSDKLFVYSFDENAKKMLLDVGNLSSEDGIIVISINKNMKLFVTKDSIKAETEDEKDVTEDQTNEKSSFKFKAIDFVIIGLIVIFIGYLAVDKLIIKKNRV